MVMLRKEGDDKKQVKKLSRLHLYIIIGVISLFVVSSIVNEVISYYHQDKNVETKITRSTKEEYVEFINYHNREFTSLRNEMARFDAIYREDPFVNREEMDEYVEMLVDLCDEAIHFPAPKEKDLAKNHEEYVQSMKDFRKAVRMYPQAYEDLLLFNVDEDYVTATDMFKISRNEFDAAMSYFQAYERGE